MTHTLRVVAAVAEHTPELFASLPKLVERDVQTYLRRRIQPLLFEATFIQFQTITPAVVTIGSSEFFAYTLVFTITTVGFLDGKEEISRAIPISVQRQPESIYTFVQTTVDDDI